MICDLNSLPLRCIVTMAALGFVTALSLGQEKPMVIKLEIKSNGRVQPTPSYVTFSIGSTLIRLPLKDGRFEIPPKLHPTTAPLTFLVKSKHDLVRISNLSRNEFQYEDWTLLLADSKYDSDNQWVVPRGASIKTSCILVLESGHIDPGSAMFVPHCRTHYSAGSGVR